MTIVGGDVYGGNTRNIKNIRFEEKCDIYIRRALVHECTFVQVRLVEVQNIIQEMIESRIPVYLLSHDDIRLCILDDRAQIIFPGIIA